MIEYFYKKWKAIKRARNIRKNKNKIPPYLKNNSFEEELNYKLWSTKGARFAASHRNHTLNKLSSKSIGYLSAYLIIIGVVNLYGIDLLGIKILDNQVGFISTAFSVLILLFSQLESSENFALKSERYHNCSLDISELYSRARFTKDFTTNPLTKQNELQQISTEYDTILKKYENHLPIDYLQFQLTKPEYFRLSFIKIKWIWLKYYGKVYLVYHILIFGPLLTLIIIALTK
ncbi:SLATT domain-containing protein [Flavobacterium sp. N502540]|uniref:SLATT domain-containing protein n=1 Tax=Flavobacterium sp. N502540 TaxID=2986838 RepID=UPI0022242855|nr:SLATT domain-containing protein [Flavobacterium sp. N502540]